MGLGYTIYTGQTAEYSIPVTFDIGIGISLRTVFTGRCGGRFYRTGPDSNPVGRRDVSLGAPRIHKTGRNRIQIHPVEISILRCGVFCRECWSCYKMSRVVPHVEVAGREDRLCGTQSMKPCVGLSRWVLIYQLVCAGISRNSCKRSTATNKSAIRSYRSGNHFNSQ